MEIEAAAITLILIHTCHFARGLTFILEPADGIAAIHRPYWLHCRAVDSFEVTYVWQFSNESIASDPTVPIITNKIVHPNGTLQIRVVKEEDIGVYSCLASVGGKTILSRKATLTKAYIATTFSINPQNTTAHFGSEITLRCEINSLPQALMLWRLNGFDIIPKVILTGTVQYGGTLVISNAGYSDAGEYKCVGVNPLLGVMRQSSPGYLLVLGKPQITTVPQNRTSQSGSTAIFNCSAMSDPEPRLLWFRSMQTGSPIQLQNSSKIFLFSNGTLVLRDITKADDGTYICVATNDYGSDRVSVHLRITVAPVFVQTPKNQTAAAGGKINFTCAAEGNPTPRVVWLKNDVRIKTENGARGTLFLEQLASRDTGTYTCMADNPVGQIAASGSLVVLFAPEFERQLTDNTVSAGASFSLQCKVTGQPVPSLRWNLPDSVTVQPTSSYKNAAVDEFGVLLVTNVTLENQGYYTCYAWNALGSATSVAFITVEGPPYFTTQPESQAVLLGSTVYLFCQARGQPHPTILWFHDDQPLTPGSRLVISPSGDLTVQGTKQEDGGLYACRAENSVGHVVASAVLSIHAPPVIVVAPSSVPVMLGQMVTLKCQATGIPVPNLHWIKDAEMLVLEDNVILKPDQTLIIANITHKDLGQYTCLARNVAGEQSATANIYLPGQPVFIIMATNITVNVSEPLGISCHVQESADGDAVRLMARWYRGHHCDSNDTLISCVDCSLNGTKTDWLRVWTVASGDLYFQPVLAGDEGWYYCAAGNEGVFCSNPVFVNVQVLPKIKGVTLTPVNDQQSHRLICLASGDPDPYVTWRSPLGQEVRGQMTDSAEGVITVTEITSTRDNGQWTCSACNILGCDIATAIVELEGSPVITDVLSESWEAYVNITCRAMGLPLPDVQYQVSNGTDVGRLPGHTVQTECMIVAVDAVQESYYCVASNAHGAVSLLLSKPLDCPTIISATPLAREVNLTFNISQTFGGLPLEALVIDYRPVAAEEWSSRAVPLDVSTAVNSSTGRDQLQEDNSEDQGGTQLGSGIVRAKLNQLMPYTMYAVRARLVNLLGAGPPNEDTLYILTRPDVPTPPPNISVGTSYRSATVTWSAPHHLNGDSGCIVYLIQLFDGWTTLLSERSLPSTHERKASFYNVGVGKYSVAVRAVNSQVEGVSEAVTIDFVITEEFPDYVPVILRVKAISHNKLSVVWQIPANPDVVLPPVDGYMVNVSSSALNTSLILTVNAATTSSTIVEDLQEGVTYSVTVAAFNKKGLGSYSAPVTVLTHCAHIGTGACSNRCSLPPSETAIAIVWGCISSALLVAAVTASGLCSQ